MRNDFKTFFLILLFAGLLGSGFGEVAQTKQSPASNFQDEVRRFVREQEVPIVKDFSDLLSIPNVASDHPNIQRNADFLVKALEQRGVSAELLQVKGAPPAVFGELNEPGAQKTLGIYAHYDGQPVDEALWTGSPWKPVLTTKPRDAGGVEAPIDSLNNNGEMRLYARSAGDDKAALIAWLSALDAIKALGRTPSVNVKFFFEGEEEAGSPHLEDIFKRYQDKLHADLWLICDGPVHQSRRMQIYFGARGVTEVEMTLYGPTSALHSGHYGNWAPNPIALLANLLSRMRDDNGKILIPGFYADVRPPSSSEMEAIHAIPDVDPELRHEFGLAWSEGDGRSLAESILLPALNLRGIQGGHVGKKTTNAIPTEATTSIDFRLVPDQTPERVKKLVEAFIARQGFHIVHRTPTTEERLRFPKTILLTWGPGYPSARTSMELPGSKALIRAVDEAIESPIIKMPTLGGSVPMYLFVDLLKAPVIGVPIANHDDNQHGPNENLRLQNLWDGIDIFATILIRTGELWQ
ncbi:MAG: M20/M25/M40 family metallo-hydrolase [Acidobacteriia bacterium]|nr:M20/M25/M40 family metallo-hydrolase [Terriglobia bacterium]